MNKKINGPITELCHANHVGSRKYFLDKAYRICSEEHRSFCCEDFRELSRTNFRQMIFRLRDNIELVTKSNPCFYKVRGIPLQERKTITNRATGDTMVDVLRGLKEQPPKIHDIKIQISCNLHASLLKLGEIPNRSNGCIQIKLPQFKENVNAKLLVYPKTVQLDIGCTNSPFIYDVGGALDLTFLLGELSHHMHTLTAGSISVPQYKDWLVTHYHFGKDASEEYSGKTFHRTIEDFSVGLIRFYSKIMEDGRTLPRIETIETPRTKLEKELQKMIAAQDVSK